MFVRFGRVHGIFANLLDTHALDEIVASLQVVRVFAVVLEEKITCFHRLLSGLDGNQQIGFADGLTCGSAYDYLPASVLSYETQILDGGLGAISWASHHAHFEFMRCKQILQTPLQFDSGARRILHSEAAELSTHASLHHANSFGVGLPRRHAQVGPYSRQIGFLDADK